MINMANIPPEQPENNVPVNEQGYILEGREYRLTGRKAVQKLASGKIKVLYELQPASVRATAPNNHVYNKWVTEKQLCPIVTDEELSKMVKK